MNRPWVLAGAALVVAAAAAGVVRFSATREAPPAQAPTPTAKVELGRLSAQVSANGTVTYRARADGAPYAVINQAGGTFTMLPAVGDQVRCGGVLYRVDDQPVLLLCGAVPTYRALRRGAVGRDVQQLNANLHALGYDARAHAAINPKNQHFTAGTQQALGALQHDAGARVTGALAFGQVVFLPEPVRIARVMGEPGGAARRATPVTQATSDTPIVQVNLGPSPQGAVRIGDRARVTLPSNAPVSGTVERLALVTTLPDGRSGEPPTATLEASIRLDAPERARGLDQAPVQVDITTRGVERALSVPVAALVGKSGGGFAVEVVRPGGERALVAVQLGLFDPSAGRVQVAGDLREGDQVVVPAS